MYRVSLLRRFSASISVASSSAVNSDSATGIDNIHHQTLSYKLKHKGSGAKRLNSAEGTAVEDAFAAANGSSSSSSFALPIDDTKRNTALLFGASFVAAMGCMAGYEAHCGGYDGAQQ